MRGEGEGGRCGGGRSQSGVGVEICGREGGRERERGRRGGGGEREEEGEEEGERAVK